MQRTVHIIINPGYDRNFKIISCKYLWRLVNKKMLLFIILSDMIFHFIKVCIRRPAIHINNCKEKILHLDHHFSEFLLNMLCTPWDIGGFSFLLILPHFVQSIINMPEFVFKLFNDLLCFLVCSLLMFFHCQEYEICELGSLMSGQKIKSLSD